MQNLVVNKASLTATAEDKTKTVGATNPSLTIVYSGFVNGEDATVLDTPPTASTTATVASGIGTYPIMVSGGSDANYDFNYVAGTLTVANAVLTVTAEDKTRAFGEANPSLTFTYIGFEGSDDASVIDTPPTISTTADANSVPGNYPITVSGASDDKYAFNYVSGDLTITKAAQTISFDALAEKTVGNVAFDLNATASSGLAVTYTSSDTNVATITGNTVTIIGVGTTTITASQAGDGNFNAAPEVAQTLTVSEAGTAVITSLEEVKAKTIKLYPNPTEDILTVEDLTGQLNYTLTDNQGKKILTSQAKDNFDLDLSKLPEGVYTLTLESQGETISKKVVKQ